MTTDIASLADAARDAASHYTGLSRRMDAIAKDLNTNTVTLMTLAKGATMTDAHGKLTAIRQEVEKGALGFAEGGAAYSSLESASRDWIRDAPTDAELAAADKAVTDAQAALKRAAQTGSGSAEEAALKAAQKHSRNLHRERTAADKAFDKACKNIRERLAKHGEFIHKQHREHTVSGHSRVKAPDVPPAKPVPAPSSSIPPATLRGTKAPATSTSSSTDGSAPAGSVDDLLNKLRQQPAAPSGPSQPPTVAPTGSPRLGGGGSQLGSQPAKNEKARDGALTTSDLASLGVPAVAAAPVVAAALRTPGPSLPMVPATSTSPGTIAAPESTPPVTGTSRPDLNTNADVTGRSDPPRGAFTAPATNLAGSNNPAGGGGTTGAPGTGTATQPGIGQTPIMPGGMPMSGPGSGGGSSRKSNPVVKYSPEQAELNGQTTTSEAVQGGTIAQRRFDDDV
ncbi:hypothetical protein [Mycobacterium sp. OTB74]|uniref:hypothetical protein n=1 Tax=Mycobacterium sp. OTB74 TaxID=1853452 RepID=UPI00247475FA|nr:hypothetical protein [Mycobacterium sp. OTB74]